MNNILWILFFILINSNVINNTILTKNYDEIVTNKDITLYSSNFDVNAKPININNKNGTFTATYKYLKANFENNGDKSATVYIQDMNGITLKNGKLIVNSGESNSMILEETVLEGTKYTYNVVTENGGGIYSGILTIQTSNTKSQLEN